MNTPISRRAMLRNGMLAAAIAGGIRLYADDGDVVIPFVESQPIGGRPTLHWDELKDWIKPMDQFFSVSHYGTAKVEAEGYKLEIGGLVEKPRSFSMDEIRALPRKEITATLECSGNGSGKDFVGAIGNARWAGTSLGALLKQSSMAAEAVEVAFWGADHKVEKLRGADYEMNFARALGLKDALRDEVILAYEMNGQPLAIGHGAPLRLVVPGWYGIAWVKWLQKIEVRDRRLMNRFMARDYVTIRGEEADGKVNWTETSVGPMNLKSVVARVVKKQDGTLTVIGAAWSGMTPVKAVEVKTDDGDWVSAKLDATHAEPFTWRFWSLEMKGLAAGEHAIVSRAVDEHANIQPAMDDPTIKLKKTYWEANGQWVRKIKI